MIKNDDNDNDNDNDNYNYNYNDNDNDNDGDEVIVRIIQSIWLVKKKRKVLLARKYVVYVNMKSH